MTIGLILSLDMETALLKPLLKCVAFLFVKCSKLEEFSEKTLRILIVENLLTVWFDFNMIADVYKLDIFEHDYKKPDAC